MWDILQCASLTDCKPCSTPVDTNPKVAASTGAPLADLLDFRNLVAAL